MTALDLPALRALAEELRSPAVFNRAVMVRGADAILALLARVEEAENALLQRESHIADQAIVIADREEMIADAWDEGAKAGLDTGLTVAENLKASGGDLSTVPQPPVNPYRSKGADE